MAEVNEKANFISLECAFAFLQKDYSGEYHGVMKLIAEDQEEPLPLDWSIVVEEWDHTYWIVWIMIIYMLWDRDGEDFELRCPDHLRDWQSGWLS
jgi:histone-lysine N-methyltransferase SETD3